MEHSVFATETDNTKGDMLDYCGSGLSVDLVTVDKGILQQWGNGVDIVLGHLADVFEQEGQGLKDTVLHVKFWYAVFVHQGWKDCEWSTSFGDNTNGNRCTDTGLTLLDSQVVQESGENVLGSNGFGNETECVVGCSADTLLVGLEHI
jgi:hypothetical protein